MSDEQKIRGVPDGWQIQYVQAFDEASFITLDRIAATVILERIQKPKRQILIAEAEVPPDFRIDGNGAILIYRSGAGVSQDIHRFPVEVLRIEERDA